MGALMPTWIGADCGDTHAGCVPLISHTSEPQSASVEHVFALKFGEHEATSAMPIAPKKESQ
jgi:hypothetical protein